MVDGLTIGRARGEDSDERPTTAQELLATYRAVEVTRHVIPAGKPIYLDEASDWSGFEFIYILKGTLALVQEAETVELRAGDFFYHAGLPERAYFRVEADSEVLMVSSPPSYHLIQHEVPEMFALARSVEEKDAATEGHCHRLERLAILTGERLGLSGQRLINLSYGAYLHDIGKVKVPSEILGKTDALTDEEWTEMRRHPTHGEDMLYEKEFLKAASLIVRAHHERYDGTGYPDGLRGEEIPIEARVISVVDAYDAITSERPYQPALARKRALEELRLGAGTHFDPRIVRAFGSVLAEDDDA
ncbi:MAG: HD domain-containing phosphohydrolase [Candidatus Bipolaricaulia bacterium]